MTIEEAKVQYSTKTYITSQGDTLTKIIDNIYQSRDDIFYYVVDKLNPDIQYHDWYPNNGFAAGIPITYFPEAVCRLIYEVTG